MSTVHPDNGNRLMSSRERKRMALAASGHLRRFSTNTRTQSLALLERELEGFGSPR